MFTLHDVDRFAMGNPREALAGLIEAMFRHHPRGGDGIRWTDDDLKGVHHSLLTGPRPDDGWDESEALDALNSYCEEGVEFEIRPDGVILRESAQ